MLRPYQIELKNDLRAKIRDGHRRLIAVLPTGAGKTFTFCSMVKTANDRGRKCVILTDRVELLKQTGGALKAFDLFPIELKAGSSPYLGGYLYVAMVETLSRRLKKTDYRYWLKQIDLIIIDECHMRSFDKIFPYLKEGSRVLGFTATPRRMGGKNVLSEFYETVSVGADIPQLIEEGHLATPKYFGVRADLEGVRTIAGEYDADQVADRFSESKLYKGVLDNWKRIADGSKTLIFSSNIASSIELVEEFNSKGVRARHLDSTMTNRDREEILDWFDKTPDAVLANVGILTKGFDQPDIRTIILYRATRSLTLYLQMVGRGSRPLPGKAEFNILDFGNNIVNHGFWHDMRDWKLKEPKARRLKKREAVLKNCKQCEAFIPAAATKCEFCGYVYKKLEKEREVARLQLLEPRVLRGRALSGTIDEMAEMVKMKLVRPHFLLHNIKDWEKVKRLVKKLGYNPWWFKYNHDRFWWGAEYLKEIESGNSPIKITG